MSASRSTSHASALIVGGQSAIGSALAERLRSNGQAVKTTTRRPGAEGQFLDLNAPQEFDIPADVSVAYLCAAVARIEACKNDPQASRRTNVAGLAALAERLAKRGVFVVFLSTNQVFDGKAPHRRADDSYSPCTEYGRQKADAEELIARLGPSSAVVRLTKVLEQRVPIFAQWRTTLQSGQSIEPFSDMWMAPVPMDFVTATLEQISAGRHPGIFQISGERDISYAEIAQSACRLWQFDAKLVRPTSALESGRFNEYIPRYTTLDVARLHALSLKPPPIDVTLERALAAA